MSKILTAVATVAVVPFAVAVAASRSLDASLAAAFDNLELTSSELL